MIDIKPKDLSYIIGFLQGDGTYYKQTRNRGRLSIELSIKDEDILLKMSSLLNGFNPKITYRIRDTNFKEDYESCILSIYVKEFRDYLEKYIPCGKKSDTVKPPEESWLVKYDYIRGLTDADGSIGITKKNIPFWSFCTGSSYLKEFIVKCIYDDLGLEKRISRNKRDNIFNIMLSNESANDFCSLLYQDSSIHLNRKYESYILNQYWERSVPKKSGTPKKWLLCEDKIITSKELSLEEKVILLKRSKNSIKTRIWRLK